MPFMSESCFAAIYGYIYGDAMFYPSGNDLNRINP